MDRAEKTLTPALDLKVKLVVFADGERFPMLIDSTIGIPMFGPTVWTTTEYRQRSASTMEQALRGAMLLHLWCAHRSIDLTQRVRTGAFFAPHELDSIEREAGKPKQTLADSVPHATKVDGGGRMMTAAAKSTSANVRFLRRMPSAKHVDAVDPQTKSLRLHYLGEYLSWLGDRQRFRIGRNAKNQKEADRLKRDYDAALKKVIVSLKTRSKGKGKPKRLSLEPGQRIELLRVTDPDSPKNVWRSPFVRLRNRAIVRWLIGTGMRRGELLSLKVRHVEIPMRRAMIVRNHDDRKDPRKKQPQAKSGARMVPLDLDLLALTERYIVERGKISAAKKHGFLFVSESGRPFSLSALTEIFADLRRVHPAVGPVTAHVLRHTYNEIFSDEADEIGMDPVAERRVRIELMGWSPTSKMPDHYLLRKTRRKSAEASRGVQRRVMREAEQAQKRTQKD